MTYPSSSGSEGKINWLSCLSVVPASDREGCESLQRGLNNVDPHTGIESAWNRFEIASRGILRFARNNGAVLFGFSRERTLESARANETTTSKGRRRLAGKTDYPDVYPSLWCHVLKSTGEGSERKQAKATTSARRDASIDARNRRFRGAGSCENRAVERQISYKSRHLPIEIKTDIMKFELCRG